MPIYENRSAHEEGGVRAGSSTEIQDNRRFHRWKVGVPASFKWGPADLRGKLSNLSYGGALLTQAPFMPPEGDSIELRFQVCGLDAHFQARVVHVSRAEGEAFGRLGIAFLESLAELEPKLLAAFRSYAYQ